jgi:hypothetical protein
MADLFVSYAREDQGFVRSLRDALTSAGRDVWVDWEDVPRTAKWMTEVFAGIEAANALVFVIGKESVRSQMCGLELNHAVEHKKRLIPLVRHQVDDAEVPRPLAEIDWIFFRESDEFDKSVSELIKALDTDLDWVQAHTRWLVRATEWERKSRSRSLLLRGSELVETERWKTAAVTKTHPALTPLQLEYVNASRQTATRRTRTMISGGCLAWSGLVTSVPGVLRRDRASSLPAQTPRFSAILSSVPFLRWRRSRQRPPPRPTVPCARRCLA